MVNRMYSKTPYQTTKQKVIMVLKSTLFWKRRILCKIKSQVFLTIFIKTDNLSELSTYFFLWIFLRWQSGRAKIHKRQFFNDISFLAQLFDDSVRNKIPRKFYKRNMLVNTFVALLCYSSDGKVKRTSKF
jgi:hypothetical protein